MLSLRLPLRLSLSQRSWGFSLHLTYSHPHKILFSIGESSSYRGQMARSSDGASLIGDDMDISSDDKELVGSPSLHDLGEPFLMDFCRKASTAFFHEYGLVSHQINSFNDFIENGIQNVFDSFGDIVVEPDHDPSKKGESDSRYALVRFGKVTLDRPQFSGEKLAQCGKEYLNLLPRHARLQNMTYSSRMKVNIHFQVYTQKLVHSDKFKTGKEQFVEKEVTSESSKDVVVGRIPIMVKSNLCWMSEAEKGDCDFDLGGYFLVKGAEKTFIAQEKVSLKKLWISDHQGWTIAYRSAWKRKRLYIKLAGNCDGEYIRWEDKILTVYFLSAEIPIWILFFALGVSSDKEVLELIDFGDDDSRVENILLSSINEADEKYSGFRQEGKALSEVEKSIKSKFPHTESIEECFDNYLFPSLTGHKQKARYLAYMVKCLLQSYTGRRKCDNQDDFRNKRLDLAGELLERELRVQILNTRRRMMRAIQRHLYPDRSILDIEHYVDASMITNA